MKSIGNLQLIVCLCFKCFFKKNPTDALNSLFPPFLNSSTLCGANPCLHLYSWNLLISPLYAPSLSQREARGFWHICQRWVLSHPTPFFLLNRKAICLLKTQAEVVVEKTGSYWDLPALLSLKFKLEFSERRVFQDTNLTNKDHLFLGIKENK